MLKRTLSLLLFLAALSLMSGYLMSKISLLGKVGIGLLYKQYSFMKIWWQGALIIFGALLLILILSAIARQVLKPVTGIIVHILSLMLAIGGLYFTYNDFRNDISHRLLGERFHIGVYLFWLGWISISLFYLFSKKKVSAPFPVDPASPKQ